MFAPHVASLRTRLFALWLMLAASAAATAFLLLEFYRQFANAQVGRAEEIVARAWTGSLATILWLAALRREGLSL